MPSVLFANNCVQGDGLHWGGGRKLQLLSDFLPNSRDFYGSTNPFEQALRAAFEPAEGVATNEVGAKGKTFPSLSLTLIFKGDKVFLAVHFAELGLFDFAGGVSRDGGKDDFARPLVAGKFLAEVVDFVFGGGHSFF